MKMGNIRVGERLGEYQILKQVGMGGMGAVYCAYHNLTERVVAVKVIHQALTGDPSARERFEREARVAAKLEHPHLLPVYTYSLVSSPAYIVMRYVDGGSLQDRIDKGPIPCDETARILEKASSALDYAHRHGVIHRDIKPSNILFDHDGQVYVTDFGLARMNDSDVSSGLTGIGNFVGTPAWMAPEQITGRDTIDNRTDVYALGVTLFQMLTGQLPFIGMTPMDTLLKHINDPVPSVRRHNPNLTSALDVVIGKAMAKRPIERYGSTEELFRAYCEVLEHGLDSMSQPAPVPAPTPVKAAPPTEKRYHPPPVYDYVRKAQANLEAQGIVFYPRDDFDDPDELPRRNYRAGIPQDELRQRAIRAEKHWRAIQHLFQPARCPVDAHKKIAASIFVFGERRGDSYFLSGKEYKIAEDKHLQKLVAGEKLRGIAYTTPTSPFVVRLLGLEAVIDALPDPIKP